MKCAICNKKLKRITNTHLKYHNCTMKQYKGAYGAIEDENLKNIRNKHISASLKGKQKTLQHTENIRKAWIKNGNRSKMSIRMWILSFRTLRRQGPVIFSAGGH